MPMHDGAEGHDGLHFLARDQPVQHHAEYGAVNRQEHSGVFTKVLREVLLEHLKLKVGWVEFKLRQTDHSPNKTSQAREDA